MIQKITSGIKVSVKMRYNGANYRNDQLFYYFNYFITIENKSSDTIQLTKRFWEIHDSLNNTEFVVGEGVVGQIPILKPKDVYNYKSGCFLTSTMGSMFGYYTMMNLETGKEIKVKIPNFQLITPAISN